MRDAQPPHVALFDRRKGSSEPTLDRRRTYVDVMERVLGNDALARARQHNRFDRQIELTTGTLGTTVTSIEVRVLDRDDDDR